MLVMQTISRAGAQDPVGHGRVVARHEALEDGRAAGQRDAGDRDGVLHRDALSREDALAALGAYAAAAHDRVERVVLGARARARLAHGLDVRRQLGLLPVECVERREDRLGHGQQLARLVPRGVEAPAAGELRQVGGIDARDHQSSRNGRAHPALVVRGDGLDVEDHLGEPPGAVLLDVAIGVSAREPDRASGRRGPPSCRAPGGTRYRSR